MYYLSLVFLFACDNSYILDPITRLEIPISLTEEQKSLLKDFEGVNDASLEEMIR